MFFSLTLLSIFSMFTSKLISGLNLHCLYFLKILTTVQVEVEFLSKGMVPGKVRECIFDG